MLTQKRSHFEKESKESNSPHIELEKYRLIFEMSPIGITTVDKKGTILDINKAGAELIGYSPEEIIGQNFRKLNIFNRRTIPSVLKIFTKVIQGKTIDPFEITVFSKEGKEYDVEVRISPIRKNGRYLGLQAMMQDITEKKKSEKKITNLKDFYEQILYNVHDGIWVTDEHDNMIYFNPGMEKILGVKVEKVLGSNIYNEFPNETITHLIDFYNKAKQTRKPQRYEIEVVTSTGKHRFQTGWFIPRFNSKYQGVICTTRDITDQKKVVLSLQESEQKFRSLVEQAAEMLFLHNTEGHIIDVNRATEKSTGFSKDELKNMSIFDIDPDAKNRNDMQKYWIGLTPEDPPTTFEVRHKRKDGTIFPTEVTVSKVILSKGEYILGLARDITERKKAEEKLQHAHKELQELNQTLEQKVEDRTEEIQQILQQKDEFINQLGHDLKNPLGPFLQLLPILKNHVSDGRNKEMVDVLDRNARYMKNLVKKTIDLAKLNSPNTQFNFKQIVLSEIIEEVIGINRSMFDDHDIEIENKVSFDYLVSADMLHVQELLTNLLNNSVKYMDGSGRIIVDAKQVDTGVLVSVEDTGIGLSKEQMPHLFDEYYKADMSRHDFESSGLGLPICKRIVERHGGLIWAESKGLGKGATFYFTLPKSDKKS